MTPTTAPAGHHAPAGAAPRPPMPRTPEPATSSVRDTVPAQVVVPRPRSEPGAPLTEPPPKPTPPAQILRITSRVASGLGGRTTVITLSGELDLSGAPDLARALSYAFDHVSPRVILDMSHLTFADTTGLAPVPPFAQSTQDSGGRLALVSPRPLTQLVLHSIGHDPVVYPTERDALLARDI